MYNINILTECSDEEIRVAIISAVCKALDCDTGDLIISKMKRGKVDCPTWNYVSRQGNLNNKF